MATTMFDPDQPWVLVEGRGADAHEASIQLRRLGYQVAECLGPDEGRPCPLIERGACALVDEAPLVVHALGDLDPGCRIAGAARGRTTVVRVTGPEDPEDAAERIPGSVMAAPVTAEKLVWAIRTAVGTDV